MMTDSARLLVLTTSFPNDYNPASGVFVHRLLANLPPSYIPTVITPATTIDTAFHRNTEMEVKPLRYAPRKMQVLAHGPGGLSVVFRRKYGKLILLPGFCWAATIMMLREASKADLIHAQWAPSGVIAGLAGWFRRRPVVTTLRGSDFDWGRGSLIFRTILRLCLCLNQRVITVSREMTDLLILWFPQYRHKIHFIPNGVEQTSDSVFDKRSVTLFKVAVVGNLIPGKRVDMVVQAFGKMVATVPKAKLVLAGDGPERNNLEMLAQRLGLKEKVQFLGMIEPRTVQDLLRSCQALVLASEKEGRPNVILEAMSAGVPVVAADIPPVRELIGMNERGLLFNPGDVDHLVSRLVSLSEDSATGCLLAQKAHAWLKDQGLTWGRTAAAYSVLYRQVLAEYQRGKAICAE